MIFKEIYPPLAKGYKCARLHWAREDFFIRINSNGLRSYHKLLYQLDHLYERLEQNDYICITDIPTEVSFIDALEGMREDKVYIRKENPNHRFKFMKDSMEFVGEYLDSKPYTLTSFDLLANDWVVIE